MKTPIIDFVRRYQESGAVRLHMPGHKGKGPLGIEGADITEIQGADSLYEAEGVIRQSEENASALFGCPTYYAAEGSSQCIRAMVHLALLQAKKEGKTPLIAAGRNAHKTFLTAAALLDVPVRWLWPKADESYLSCTVTAEDLEKVFREEEKPSAVYITSPDYLGNTADIAALARVCHRNGALLLVDNAHGAYLRFLEPSRHPMDLGADLCCDSAHKTLPVLTGGAYLHTGGGFSEWEVRTSLALFGSTSPSYLILQSLDGANPYLQTHRQRLAAFLPHVEQTKEALTGSGYTLWGMEPLKITIAAKPYGYRGTELADLLRKQGIECEFADPDFLVLMLTPEVGEEGLGKLTRVLGGIPPKTPVSGQAPVFAACQPVLTPREVMLAPAEEVTVDKAVGRILAASSVGCPPAVPIVVSGERINEQAVERFRYYGVANVTVVRG